MKNLYRSAFICFMIFSGNAFGQFTPDMLFKNGLEAFYDARFQDGVNYFTDYIKSNNNDFKGYNYRGLCYQAMKNYPRSIEDFTRVISVAPNNSDGYLNRGNTYFFNNNNTAAMQDYADALKLTPNMFEAYFGKSRVLIQLRRFDEALKAIIAAEGIAPNNARVYVNKAFVRALLGDTVETFNNIELALYKDSNIVFTDYRRDLMYVKIESYKQAMATINQLIQINPNSYFYYFLRGFTYFLLNSFDKANKDLETAVKLYRKDDAQFNNLISKINRSIERNSNSGK